MKDNSFPLPNWTPLKFSIGGSFFLVLAGYTLFYSIQAKWPEATATVTGKITDVRKKIESNTWLIRVLKCLCFAITIVLARKVVSDFIRKPPVEGIPNLSIPSLSIPSLSVPSLSVPSLSVPSLSVPSLSVPSLSVPSLSVPSLSAPSLSAPSLSAPSLSAPSLSAPSLSVSSLSIPTPATSFVPAPPAIVKRDLAPQLTSSQKEINSLFSRRPR
jgi:hypothetical protein